MVSRSRAAYSVPAFSPTGVARAVTVDVERVTALRRGGLPFRGPPMGGSSALAGACALANAGLDLVGATGGGDHVGGVRDVRVRRVSRRCGQGHVLWKMWEQVSSAC